MNDKSNRTYNLVLCGVFTAVAVVIGLTRFELGFVRIVFYEPFLYFIGAIISPVLSAVAFGVNNVLLFFLKPSPGAFIWEILLVTILKGLLFGAIYHIISKFNRKVFNITTICLAIICFIAAGIFFYIGYFPEESKFLETETIKKVSYIGYVAVGLGILFICIFIFEKVFIVNEARKNLASFFKVFVPVFITGMVVTTLNTVFLVKYNIYPSNINFLLVLAPRLLTSFLTSVYNTVVLIFLIKLYKKSVKKSNEVLEKRREKKKKNIESEDDLLENTNNIEKIDIINNDDTNSLGNETIKDDENKI